MNPFLGPNPPAEPNPFTAHYLAGQVSLEVAAAEFDQAVRCLAHDVTATLGARHVPVVWSFAAHAWTLDIEDPSTMRDRCVEDVQQYFQDTFVDTTWPACPQHPNHPLDYADGSWRCPRDQTVVARLGELDEPS